LELEQIHPAQPAAKGQKMNVKNVAVRLSQISLGALFVMAGAGKLAGGEQTVQQFRVWGYSDGFRILIGLLEVLGGVGLLIPRIAAPSALGLMAIMVGAAYTHLANHEGLGKASTSIILLLLLWLVAYVRRDRFYTLLATFKGSGNERASRS
jgi:putative oxidoreductase